MHLLPPDFLGSSAFMPHGHCYLWTPGVLWLHVVSDALITLSYYSIPLTLAWFVRRRRDVDFRWMFLCFALFIVACGSSHAMEIWNVWHGDYWISGGVKGVTALASVPTAILLARLIPQALTLPSPTALRKANQDLLLEAAARRTAEQALQKTNGLLERRVATRTAELKTAIVQLQEAFEQVQQFAAIVESSHDAYISKDLSGNVTSWNAAAEVIFGYTAQEMVGQPISRLILPDLQAVEQSILTRIKRGEAVEDFDALRLRKDGTIIHVAITVAPIKDADGRVIGASKVARDVTERRRVEAALRKEVALLHAADRRLAETLKGMSEACFTLDAQWRFTFVNDQGETLFHQSRHDLLGKSIWDCAPVMLGTPMEANCRRVMTQRTPASFETFSPLANGWLDVRLFPNADGLAVFLLNIQERKEAEQAMAASETRYRRLFESAKDGILILDAETGVVVDVNPFLITMLGYSHEQFLGKAIWELGFLRDVVASEDNFAELRAKDYIRYENLPLETSDGRRIDVEFVSNVYLVDNAKVIQCEIRDVTERVRAETALRASEERMRLATEASGVGIWEWNVLTGTLHWDAEMFRIYGVPTTEDGLVPYAAWSNAVPAAELPAQEAALLDTVRRGGRGAREFRIRRANDGEVRNVESVETVRKNAQGKVEWVLGTNLDVTKHKQLEAAVRESEERFRTMANSMPQLAWIARADGFITWYNERFYDFTGTTPEQIAGWSWESVHDPAMLPIVMEKWTGAIRSGQPFEMEFPLRGAGGQFRSFLTRARPLKDAEGCVTHWFGTNTDVQTLKNAEEKIRMLNAGLEQRVAERTSELQAANKELESFSYSVSHDLRAPIRAIDGYSQAVIEDFGPLLPEEGRKFLQVVRNEAGRMGQLIDDLLAFSRLGRTPIAIRDVDTGALVRGVLAGFAGQVERRRIEVLIGNLPSCMGDIALLRQVWTNLLSNAVKYTGRRTTAVIEVGASVSPEGTVFFVRDNGAGFDMAYADKLFGVFQRLHLADEFEGTGVGLALVQRIIFRHGGRIWAEAAVGQGAAFFFTLAPPSPHERDSSHSDSPRGG